MKLCSSSLKTSVSIVTLCLLFILVEISYPASPVLGTSSSMPQTSGSTSVTFTFENGNNGQGGGIVYGSPSGNPPFVRDGFIADIVQTGSISGGWHFHELDSTLNDKVPDRSIGEQGVLWRDGFAYQDPLFFKPVDPNATFSLESLIVGTTSADDAAARVQLTGFLHGKVVGTIILVPPVDGYVSYSTLDLGTLQGLEIDRLEFLALGDNETGYYMLDNVVFNTGPHYRLPFVGLKYISNGPGCGQGNKKHEGFTAEAIDYEMVIGTPVYASEAGVIEFVGSVPNKVGKDLSGFGLFIKIRHPHGSRSYYAHLSNAVAVAGPSVTKGQLIAYSGDSGKAGGHPHLHFQIMDADGTNANPIPIRTLPGTTWYSHDPNNPCNPKPKTRDGEALGPGVP